MTEKPFARRSSGLIRQASLFDTFIFNSSASSFVVILGSYAFAVTFTTGGDLLSAIPVAMISFSIAIVYAMLVATFPRSGGDYVFNSRVLHPSLGFGFNFSLVFWQTFFLAFNYYLICFSGLGPGLHIIGYILNNPTLINVGTCDDDALGRFPHRLRDQRDLHTHSLWRNEKDASGQQRYMDNNDDRHSNCHRSSSTRWKPGFH